MKHHKEKTGVHGPMEKVEAHRQHHSVKKRIKLDTWKIISGILLILLAISFFRGSACSEVEGLLTQEKAGQKIIDFINENLMQEGTEATLTSISEESGAYKMQISANGQTIDSYVTKDGNVFFPQAMVLEEVEKELKVQKAAATSQEASDVEKTVKPIVELFVMSHCPYGTQIEKGMIPVMELLGDKADIEIKFCDYAMHGEKELAEELNQYCIQSEQNDKFIDYLKCFLGDGNGDKCLTETGVDRSMLSVCVAKTDAEYKVMDNFKNNEGYRGRFPGFELFKTETTKYGVSGSPTLVINGKKISSNRDSSSLLKAVCDAFTDEAKPADCNTALDSASPSPGFGYNAGSASAASGGCGA